MATTTPEDLSKLVHAKLTQLQEETTVAISDEAFDKQTKRDLKEIKTFLQSTKTPEEKITELGQRVTNAITLLNKKHQEMTSTKIKAERISKERDILAAETLRDKEKISKLENLARELQKHNKAVMEESAAFRASEQQKRQEMGDQVSKTLEELRAKMDEQDEERTRVAQENETLRTKLRELITQYELHEQQTGKMIEAKELEKKISEMKMMQAEELASRTAMKSEMELKIHKETIEAYAKREKDFQDVIAEYKKQLTMYQEAIQSNAKHFEEIKTTIQSLKKHNTELEKENKGLKEKSKQMDVRLVQSIAENETLKKEKEKLSNLSRALQKKLQDATSASASASQTQTGTAAE